MSITPDWIIDNTNTPDISLEELIVRSGLLDRPIILDSIRQSLDFFGSKAIDTKTTLQSFEKSLKEQDYFYLNNALINLYITYIENNNAYLLTINNNTQDDIDHVLRTYKNQKDSFLLKHQKWEISWAPFPFSPDDLISDSHILNKISKTSNNIVTKIIGLINKKNNAL